jgi:mannose-6-phosphate isomerase-like protein (cupin superfamily)
MKYKSLRNLPLVHVSHQEAIFKQVLLSNGEVPHITNFSQAKLAKGQQVEEHAHLDMTEVYFVLQGRGEIIINSVVSALEPGVCVVVEPTEKHSVLCVSDEPLVLLYFGVVD